MPEYLIRLRDGSEHLIRSPRELSPEEQKGYARRLASQAQPKQTNAFAGAKASASVTAQKPGYDKIVEPSGIKRQIPNEAKISEQQEMLGAYASMLKNPATAQQLGIKTPTDPLTIQRAQAAQGTSNAQRAETLKRAKEVEAKTTPQARPQIKRNLTQSEYPTDALYYKEKSQELRDAYMANVESLRPFVAASLANSPAAKALGLDKVTDLAMNAVAGATGADLADAGYEGNILLSKDATLAERGGAAAGMWLKTGAYGAYPAVKAGVRGVRILKHGATAVKVGEAIAEETSKGIRGVVPKVPAVKTGGAPEQVGVTYEKPVSKPQVPKVTPKTPTPEAKPSTVSHADTDELRKVLGMEDRPKTIRKDSELMESAKAHDPFAVASKVNKGEAVTDAEQVAMGVRLQSLRKEIEAAKKAGDVPTFTDKFSQAEEIADALDKAGSEAGRAMRARRLLVDENFDEFGLKRTLEKAKGSPLTAKENSQIDELVKQNKDLSNTLKTAQDELATMRANSVIKEQARRSPRFDKKDLDAELDSILKEFKDTTSKVGAQTNDFAHVVATLGTAGTKLVYKVAVNYAKRGINQIDDLVAAVGSHFPGLSREDLIDVIANAGEKNAPRTPSAIMKQIADLKKQAKAQSPTRAAEIQKKIDELVTRMKTQDFTVDAKDVKLKSKQVEMLEAQRDLTRKRFEALRKAAADDSSLAWKAVKGTGDAVRGAQLGFDLGAILRQGYFGLSHPKKQAAAIWNGLKAMKSDKALQIIENNLNSKMIGDKPAMAVRSKSGLYMADTLSQPEETFLSGFISKLPGVGKIYDAGERFTTGFLNTYRAEMFDWFAKKTPNATEAELKSWAKWVNSTSGRSNLKEVPKVAQVLFTSPRYAASRFEVIGRIATSPVLFRNAGDRQVFMEAIKTGGTILTIMKMAEAAGAEVSFDPESSDFMKIRVGDTTYDATAGVGNSGRLLIRAMLPVLRGKAPAFGKDAGTEAGRFLTGKLSPFITVPFEASTDSSVTGFELPEDEKGWNALAPIIIAQLRENIKKDGYGKGSLKTLPELLGVGSNTYPKGEPKSVTKD